MPPGNEWKNIFNGGFSPGRRNRLSEILHYICGQDLILNNVKAALGMPLDTLHDPEYSGAWAELIVHSDQRGFFKMYG